MVGRHSQRAGRGQEVHLVGRDVSRRVKKFFWRDKRVGRGRESLPAGWEWLRSPLGRLGGVRSPPEGPGGMRSPSQRAGRGREALLEGRKKSRVRPEGMIGVGSHHRRTGGSVGPPKGPGGSGVPSGVPGGVGKHLRKAGRGWEVLGVPQEGREDWRLSRRVGRVRSSFQSAGRGRESLLEGWQWSGGLSGGRGGSGRIRKPCRRAGIGREPSHMAVRVQEGLGVSQEGQDKREAFLKGREVLGGPSG